MMVFMAMACHAHTIMTPIQALLGLDRMLELKALIPAMSASAGMM